MERRQLDITLNPEQEFSLLMAWNDDAVKKLLYNRIRSIATGLTQASLLAEQDDEREAEEYMTAVLEFVFTCWVMLNQIFYSAEIVAESGNDEFGDPAHGLARDDDGNAYRVNLARMMLDCAATLLDNTSVDDDDVLSC